MTVSLIGLRVRTRSDGPLRLERDMGQGQVQVGQTVRYADPLNALEAQARYTVIEVNGDRGFMRLQCDWAIAPVTLVRWSDVAVAS